MQCLYRFCPLRSLASATDEKSVQVHRRRGGSYLFLDKKVTKNQGLDLMSDKFVKAFLVVSTSPDEESGKACCLGVVVG
ncbi:hypothetical protein QF042_003674 [Pedobacter sp. W3I1]|nr:hypothetical protein [Pedobacter sp. W3I1]